MLARRTLLTAATALLARPALSASRARVLRFVPESNLATIDPVWNITPVTRNHGMMVWDMLYGRDSDFVPRPQMLAGTDVSPDQLSWRFTLREGLLFHDNMPVRAADCIASIRRWAVRRPLGQRLLALATEMKVLDDRQFDIHLRRPFAQMPYALSEFCYIMPERIARTDPNTRITEVIGSGPFRFIADEWVSGAKAAYSRFDGYQPRAEPASFTAGGKRAWFERVEWIVMPDPATAANALQSGEVDWVQQPQFDLLPLPRKARDVSVLANDRVGVMGMLALNQLHPPFDNAQVRRAILSAIEQRDFMTAAVGDDTTMWRSPIGVFTPGMAMANDAGMQALTAPRDIARSKALLQQAGYRGAKVTVMGAVDNPVTFALSQVAADLFRQLGMPVDFINMDLGTLVQRRANKGTPSQGGWNAFTTTYEGLTMADPATNVGLRGNGTDAWFGWPTSPPLEQLREAWFDAPDETARREIARRIQVTAFDEVPFVPLGQLFYPTAIRSDLEGLLPSPFPIFWSINRRG